MSKMFQVQYTAGDISNYENFDAIEKARQFVDDMEKTGFKCAIVERTLQGKNRGQEWTVYRSPSLTSEY